MNDTPVESLPPAAAEEGSPAEPAVAQPAWRLYQLAVIDDAIHPPRLDRIPEAERTAVTELLEGDAEALAELAALSVPAGASVDERLVALACAPGPTVTTALLANCSVEGVRMVEEHRSYLRLIALL